MGNTTNHNIYFLSNGDPQSQITESATQAGTIETALDSVSGDIESVNNFGVRYFANASARDLALVSPSVGWLTQLDSELFMRRWDGAAWVPYGASEFRVVPSSVTSTGGSASVTGSGVITFSGVNPLNCDGVFSSEFSAYRLDYILSPSASTMLRLVPRFLGANSSANNPGQWTQGTGTSVTTGIVSETVIRLTPLNDGRSSGHIILESPSSSSGSMFTGAFGAVSFSGATAYTTQFGGVHNSSTPFDGFGIYPSSVTPFSGTITVTAII